MRAIVWTAYGPPEVLRLQEVEKPAPKKNEILVKVHATTVTTGDCEMRNLQFPYWIRIPIRLYIGLRKPTRITIPGMYLAGEVEAVGNEVTRFNVGDPIFGMAGMGLGAYAEYISLPEAGVAAIKPANMTYAEAAPMALGGLEALHFLRMADVQPGERLLINGAGGSIGTFGIQLAKHFGAEVTAVDSTPKLEMLRSVGADHVIDYTQEDFTENGQTYDILFDVIGKSPFSRSLKSLSQHGRYLIANPSGLIQFVRGRWASRSGGKKVMFEMTSPKAEDLNTLKVLIETGKIKTVIDRCFTLEEIPEAHRYVESGQKIGNVIISVSRE
ncbi:MAG: NAD(P)-dependent alcohol dehydrogenase [Caldilineaceae bacterium]|nr:NAD(P)-dependent alcohol dehydrogenase [Caldilineaceae bacterium]